MAPSPAAPCRAADSDRRANLGVSSAKWLARSRAAIKRDAALAAAGAALYWWGYTQGRSTERVSLAPIISDQLSGLVVAGTWR